MVSAEVVNLTLQALIRSRPVKITVKEAAKIMGVTPRYIQYGLQQERLPFGTAVKMEGRWSYYINTERFIKYMNAGDMDCGGGGGK